MPSSMQDPGRRSNPLTAHAFTAQHLRVMQESKRSRRLKSVDLLQIIVDEPSNEDRVEFMRSLVFRLYSESLANGRLPRNLLVESLLPSGEPTCIHVQPFVERLDALAALVKTLFSSKSRDTLQALPCRVEDEAGSGLGLMLLVQNDPAVLIGPLAGSDRLFLRQIEAAGRNAVQPKTVEDTRRAPHSSVAKPLSSAFLNPRKPK